jgi:hypothetical protein
VYSATEVLLNGRQVGLQIERSMTHDTLGLSAFLTTWNALEGQEVLVSADHLTGVLQWQKDVLLQPIHSLKPEDLPTGRPLQWGIVWEMREPNFAMKNDVCTAFQEGEDERALKILKRQLKKVLRHKNSNAADVKDYPCVKWHITPEAVQASLPAFASTVVVMEDGTRRRELVYTVQLGRESRLFGLIKAKTGVNKLVDIRYQDSLIHHWLAAQRIGLAYTLRDGDTLVHPTMPPPDEWLLLRDRYQRPDYNFYNMHPSQEGLWEQSLVGLEADKDLFSLCLLTGHINHGVRIQALRTLEHMQDLRAVPYLLELLKYEINFDYESLSEAERNEKVEFRRNVLRTLASLLKCNVNPSMKTLLNDKILNDYLTFFSSRVIGAELKAF